MRSVLAMVQGQHVPLGRDIMLPRAYWHVYEYLARHDSSLRIRRSIEWVGHYVIERRCRRAPSVNTAMREASDAHIQARDGYIHVSTVHPQWLERPWNIIRALKEEGADLWAQGGAEKVNDELCYEENWQRETRRRRRYGLFRDIAAESYDTVNRLGAGKERSGRTRISNAGVPQPVASASPAA